MSTALTLVTSMAKRFELESSNGQELMDTLKQTAFKGNVSDAQFTALMVVAQQYGLNPFVREIYAFPDRNNGIVPVVGVDGWARIINENQQFDGLEFEQDEESCTCIIYRKDRAHPIKVTEWLSECKRQGQGPWQSHPKRMLRHKALIQAARLAFGFTGIYDQDEAERIVEIDAQTGEIVNKPVPKEPVVLPAYTQEKFDTDKPRMMKALSDGKPVSGIIANIKSRYTLTPDQEIMIQDMANELTTEGAE